MSGPKVVRIVTREEIIAVCRAHIARLDAARSRWERDLVTKGLVTEHDIDAVTRRRDAIAALMERDAFMELQKSVVDEIAFLKDDQRARDAKAAQAKARAQTVAQRQIDAARALLKSLQASAQDAPADVIEQVKAAASGKGDVAAALRAGFAALSASDPSDKRSEVLAAQLKDGAAPRLLTDWLGAQPVSAEDAVFLRIEAKIGEIEDLRLIEPARSLDERLQLLRAGREGAPRALAIDSLILDVDKALEMGLKRADILERVELTQAELNAFTSDAEAPPSLSETAPVEDLEQTLVHLEQALADAKALQAADARRRAVLEGLAALGYEVGSELSTAWVDDGRVVLRRPAQPGYGVEVSGGAAAERLQMRVVAFDNQPADKARDRDAEVLWCGDVDKLSQALAQAGSDLIIEKSLPVGATPVKRVRANEDALTERAAVKPKSRSF